MKQKKNRAKNPYRSMGKKKFEISAFGTMDNAHWIHILVDPQKMAVEVHDSLYHLPLHRKLHPLESYHGYINEILHRYQLPLVGASEVDWSVSVVCDIKQTDSFSCGPCVLMKVWEKYDPSTCPLLWSNPPPIEEYRELIYQEVQKNMGMLGLEAHFEKAVDQAFADVVSNVPGGSSNPLQVEY